MLSRCIARAIAILGITASAAGSAGAQSTLKIGMVMPMTGALAAAGRQVVAGARLYVKQHGDVVAGRQIELVVKDGASSAETGKRLLQELIVNEKVDIIGGGLTADLLASASLITEAQKPTVICSRARQPWSDSRPTLSGPVVRSPNPRGSWPTGPSRAVLARQ